VKRPNVHVWRRPSLIISRNQRNLKFEALQRSRAVWADLLALGGQSRIPGVICAGEENGKRWGQVGSAQTGYNILSEAVMRRAGYPAGVPLAAPSSARCGPQSVPPNVTIISRAVHTDTSRKNGTPR